MFESRIARIARLQKEAIREAPKRGENMKFGDAALVRQTKSASKLQGTSWTQIFRGNSLTMHMSPLRNLLLQFLR